MAKERVSMPMSGAGIMGMGTENMSSLQIRPSHVIALVIVICVLVLLLHVINPLAVGSI